MTLAGGFLSRYLSLHPRDPRKELRPHSSRGGWRERGPPPSLPRPSPCVGFGLRLLRGVVGRVPNKGWRWPRARRGWRRGAGGSSRPFGSSVPHRSPAQYAPFVQAARKPWQGPHSPPPEQPARRPACLIRSSLTSSAKLSRVNPISSNHSVWHVLLVFVCSGFFGGKCTRSRNVWDNNVGAKCLSPEPQMKDAQCVPQEGCPWMGFSPGLTNRSHPPRFPIQAHFSPSSSRPSSSQCHSLEGTMQSPPPFPSTVAAGVRARELRAFEGLTPGSATHFAVSHSFPWVLIKMRQNKVMPSQVLEVRR